MAKRKAPRGFARGKWTESSLKFLHERYLAKDGLGREVETPEGMVWRVASQIAGIETNFGKSSKEIKQLAKNYYDLMVSRFFMPNSPTLINAGKDDGLQYSACFVLPVEDSIEAIFEAIKNAALIHKSGGGTGFSFSRLRPKGSIVRSTSGVASGPVSFMRVFDSATNEIKQGGTRRGANMGVLRIDHPDILGFIESKAKGGITNFNISVAMTDEFIKAVKKDGSYWLIEPHGKKKIKKLKAKQVFKKIVEQAWKTGDPGVLFIDRVNKSRANPVPSQGPIEATNPCVVGSTLIATEKGLIKIKDLVVDKMKVKVVTDDRVVGESGLSTRSLTRYIDNGVKEIWRLQTKSGYGLTATADHKIMTTQGWIPLGQLKVRESKVLIQAGEGNFNQSFALPFVPVNEIKGQNGKISRFNFPTKWSEQLGQVLGWLVGDGWLRQGDKNCRVGFSFGKDDKPILDHLKPIINNWHGREIQEIERENGVWHLSYHRQGFVDFFTKLGVKPVKAGEKEVPEALFAAPREVVIGFLQGLFSADGTVNFLEGRNAYVRLTSKSSKLLKQVQLLLLNLGIPTQIYNRSRPVRKSLFQYETKDGTQKNYQSDGVLFELGISRQPVVAFLNEIGFLVGKHEHKVKKLLDKRYYRKDYSDEVISIESAGKEKVFDLTEPATSSYIANGLVISNCGEQPLYSNEACNLGSLNLARFLNKKKDDLDWHLLKEKVHLSVRFLDDVIEANPFPLKQIDRMVRLNRRIGLGVMGWADLLFELEIPYASPKALRLAEKTIKFIQKEAHLASQNLAQERGAFPNFKKSIYKDGKPLRNATLTTIAPSGSISVITGCSSGIEPIFALCFKHRTEERELTFINPYFKGIAKKLGLNSDVWEKIEAQGNLEGIGEVPKKIRKIFVTAHEVAWQDHIATQAVFQKGTDNAVSKTINLPHQATQKDVHQSYLKAHETGCMGVTVFRDGCKQEQVLYSGLKEKEKPVVEIDKSDTARLKVKSRPKVVSGKTYRIVTPVGTAFVTVNTNGNNEPLEVFVNVGKAGSAIMADAEAIGRLISLSLKVASPYPTKEVLWQVIDQLNGISGGDSVGFGKDRILSLADGVAHVLSEYYQEEAQKLLNPKGEVSPVVQQPSLLSQSKRRDLCPDCGRASLIFQEGCAKCLYCGYNKC